MPRIVEVETRSHPSLRSMSLSEQLRVLRADSRRALGLWRRHPRAMAGRWALAMTRCFAWHRQNNNFRKLIFFLVTSVVTALLLGDAALGWTVDEALFLPFLAIWFVAFGVILGFEVERISVAGVEFDVQHGEVREAGANDDDDGE